MNLTPYFMAINAGYAFQGLQGPRGLIGPAGQQGPAGPQGHQGEPGKDSGIVATSKIGTYEATASDGKQVELAIAPQASDDGTYEITIVAKA